MRTYRVVPRYDLREGFKLAQTQKTGVRAHAEKYNRAEIQGAGHSRGTGSLGPEIIQVV